MKTIEQLREEMNALIPRDVIEEREGGFGKKLSYLPGFYVINRLNEVLGQGNWSTDVTTDKLWEGTIKDRNDKDVYYVSYKASVVLTVKFPNEERYSHTQFQDVGFGDGTDKNNPGKAHELALKEAVTDGLKRAARLLGNSFGNGLYDKSGAGIEAQETKTQSPVGATVKPQATPTPKSRDTINKLISQTSKVIVDSKRLTQDQVFGMLKEFKVEKKEDLTNEQADSLLTQLQAILA